MAQKMFSLLFEYYIWLAVIAFMLFPRIGWICIGSIFFFFFIYPVTSCSFFFFCMDPQIKIILGDKSVYGVLLCNIHWHQQQFRWHYLLRRQYSKHDDFKWKLSAWITFVLMKITPQTCSYQIIYFLWHSDFKMVIKTW